MNDRNFKRRLLVVSAILVAFLAGGLVIRFGAIEVNHLISWIPYICPIKATLGISCPGCGMTHSFLSLIKGNIAQALRHNPLLFILILTAIIAYLRIVPKRIESFFYGSMLTVILIVWIMSLATVGSIQ